MNKEAIEQLEMALKIKGRISPDYSKHTIKLAVDEIMVIIEDALTNLRCQPPVEGKTYNPDPPPAGEFTKDFREQIGRQAVGIGSLGEIRRMAIEACAIIDRTEAAFIKYGQHLQGCPLSYKYTAGNECTCGFDAIKKEGETK